MYTRQMWIRSKDNWTQIKNKLIDEIWQNMMENTKMLWVKKMRNNISVNNKELPIRFKIG